ncbi:MAG: hypothetical protein ABIC95_03515 [archaeon]
MGTINKEQVLKIEDRLLKLYGDAFLEWGKPTQWSADQCDFPHGESPGVGATINTVLRPAIVAKIEPPSELFEKQILAKPVVSTKHMRLADFKRVEFTALVDPDRQFQTDLFQYIKGTEPGMDFAIYLEKDLRNPWLASWLLRRFELLFQDEKQRQHIRMLLDSTLTYFDDRKEFAVKAMDALYDTVSTRLDSEGTEIVSDLTAKGATVLGKIQNGTYEALIGDFSKANFQTLAQLKTLGTGVRGFNRKTVDAKMLTEVINGIQNHVTEAIKSMKDKRKNIRKAGFGPYEISIHKGSEECVEWYTGFFHALNNLGVYVTSYIGDVESKPKKGDIIFLQALVEHQVNSLISDTESFWGKRLNSIQSHQKIYLEELASDIHTIVMRLFAEDDDTRGFDHAKDKFLISLIENHKMKEIFQEKLKES